MTETAGNSTSTSVTAPLRRFGTPMTTVATGNAVPQGIGRQLRPSVVTLLGPTGSAVGTGVVFDTGLILVAASTLTSAAALEVETDEGIRLAATPVGWDSQAGVGVLRAPVALPTAAFADAPLQTGSSVFSACLCGGADSDSSAIQVGTTEVAEAGDGASLIDAIDAGVPSHAPAGSLLIDGQGRVLGIEAGTWRTRDGDKTTAMFVPGWLAKPLAENLAAGRGTEHGWLGVYGSASRAVCGVAISSVLGQSPAEEANLVPGDTITAVDGQPVCQPADLKARLYVDPPGHQISLGLLNASATPETVAVSLGSGG